MAKAPLPRTSPVGCVMMAPGAAGGPLLGTLTWMYTRPLHVKTTLVYGIKIYMRRLIYILAYTTFSYICGDVSAVAVRCLQTPASNLNLMETSDHSDQGTTLEPRTLQGTTVSRGCQRQPPPCRKFQGAHSPVGPGGHGRVVGQNSPPSGRQCHSDVCYNTPSPVELNVEALSQQHLGARHA